MDPIIKFGTSGWRGIIADTFTYHSLHLAAEAFARVLRKESEDPSSPISGMKPLVLVGFDARFMGPQFAEDTARILMGHGFEVRMVDRDTPTPVLAFGILHHRAIAAVNITASHNPPEYSGFKISLWNGAGAPKEWTNAIEEEAGQLRNSGWAWSKPGGDISPIPRVDLAPPYLARISEIIDFKRISSSGVQFGVDAMHGAGRGYLSRLLSEHGCSIHAIREDLNPLFEGRNPEPDIEGMAAIRKWMLDNKAQASLGLDGDADRFGILDADGTWLTPNQILPLVLFHLTKNKGYQGSIVRTVPTSHQVQSLAESMGIKVHETPVGFKHIAAIMESEKVIVGGEESGGLSILGHVPEKDGILACLLIAELIAFEKRSLKDILEEISAVTGPYFTSRINIPVNPDSKNELMAKLAAGVPSIGTSPVRESVTTDGFKFLLDDGEWVAFRASGTEPVFRCYIEARSEENFSRLQASCKELLSA